MVERMIRDLSGLEPDHTVNPDEAVARGASLYARFLTAMESEDIDDIDFEVVDVNAHSLGIDGIDPETLRRMNVIMLPRNTSLPAKITKKFVTKQRGQETIAIRVLQGENSQPDYCTSGGRTVIRGLPPDLPRGWPVEVTFEYGMNGRLNVKAEVPGTHREIALELERDTTLSEAGLARWKEVMSQEGGFDVLEAALEDIAAQREQVPAKVAAAGAASMSEEGSVWDTSPHGFAPPAGAQASVGHDRQRQGSGGRGDESGEDHASKGPRRPRAGDWVHPVGGRWFNVWLRDLVISEAREFPAPLVATGRIRKHYVARDRGRNRPGNDLFGPRPTGRDGASHDGRQRGGRAHDAERGSF